MSEYVTYKRVPGYPDYLVSSEGAVYSLKGKTGRFLKPQKTKTGYYCITLGKYVEHRRYIHRLVAEVFLTNPEGVPYVNHKNRVKHDNHVDNLEWCSHAENMSHWQSTAPSAPNSFDYLKEWLKAHPAQSAASLSARHGIEFRELYLGAPYLIGADGSLYSRHIKGFLKGDLGKFGYIRYTTNKGRYLAHRLVARAFIPNPKNKPQVNHIDGNKANNHVDNLEWSNRKENAAHAVNRGLYKRGQQVSQSKLTRPEVVEIKYLLANGFNCADLARAYGVTWAAIKCIKVGKTWAHIP